MARFKNDDNSQGLFLTVNLSEQLLVGTFEWTLNYLIDRMDLSLFEQNYHNDEKGAAAYPPRALLKVILYCYSNGILSSRRIEQAGKNNIIVKSLAADNEPDHDTIATFISMNSKAVTDLFTQVVMQCDELELITAEMFALDGCKLPSNASKEWSGTIENLKKKKARLEKHVARLVERHKKLDADGKAKRKQEPYRKTMGDDKERRGRHIQRIEKKLEKLDKFLETAKPRAGAGGEEVQSNITDNESARIKGPHGYIQGYNGIAIADSGNQIIVSAEAVGSGSESGSFPGMLDRFEENMKKATGKEKLKKKTLCLGDTGFFSEENLQEAAKRGIQVIIPDPQFRQRDPDFEGREKAKGKKRYTAEDFKYNKRRDTYRCPAGKLLRSKGAVKLRNNEGKKYQASASDCGKCPLVGQCITVKNKNGKKHARTLYIAAKKYEKNLSEKMRKKIDDPAYRELYSRRQQIIEPVFSDIEYCKGMDRFTLRGREKVDIQWKLYCIVHNIGKCVKPLGKQYGA
jgi:transposase